MRVSKSQLGDIKLYINLIWDLLALLKEISDLLTNLPEILLYTIGCIAFIDLAVFRKRLNAFLCRFLLGEFNRVRVVFIKVNGFGNQVTHLISLQAIVILKHLGLSLLSSEGIADEAKLKVKILGHLRTLLVGSGIEIQLDDLLDCVAKLIIVGSLRWKISISIF